MAGQDEQRRFQLQLPEELAGGVYANFLRAWHTGHEFTLDFAVTQPARSVEDADGSRVTEVPCRVTARVKVPPTLVFDIIRTLSDNLSKYEDQHGPVERPGGQGPAFPPDDLTGGPDGGDAGPGEG